MHDTCSFAPLDERYFGEMCFYNDAHDALLRNKGALLDPHAFGEAFDASLEAMNAWQTVRCGSERCGELNVERTRCCGSSREFHRKWGTAISHG